MYAWATQTHLHFWVGPAEKHGTSDAGGMPQSVSALGADTLAAPSPQMRQARSSGGSK